MTDNTTGSPIRKETFFCRKRTLNCRGKIINLSSPVVMGIMNITPDSFYDGGRHTRPWDAIKLAEKLLDDGAHILDMGAASSRPGAAMIDPAEEQERLMPALKAVLKQFPEAIISVDTYHASTARIAIDSGAHMINDISAGSMDDNMFHTVARLQVPYVIMHMQGRPDNMQKNPRYNHLVKEVAGFFSERINKLRDLGVHDIVIDPGFGFGKTLEHNYQLLANLDYFAIFDLPVLVGFSRKSMINKVLNTSPDKALNGTTVLNTIALQKGADILRVHDAKEALEAIKISGFLKKQQ
ncbi:MAG: dihydropteroate synthase [Bacteroidia bacterium]|nr:MAG: dihydropteroate synthase [Bacteroidia bacterium]